MVTMHSIILLLMYDKYSILLLWKHWSSICKLVSYTQQLAVPGDTGTQCTYVPKDTRNQVQRPSPSCTKLTAVQVCLKLFNSAGKVNHKAKDILLKHYNT